MSKPWDGRFHVGAGKDSPPKHDSSRADYRKWRRQRLRALTLPRHTASPRQFLPSVRRHSREWDGRFNVCFSKDNPKFHSHFREYFDSPKDLNYPLLSTQRQLFDQRTPPRLRPRHS